jgi:hypothetical protein
MNGARSALPEPLVLAPLGSECHCDPAYLPQPGSIGTPPSLPPREGGRADCALTVR